VQGRNSDLDSKILSFYNTLNPEIAYFAAGLRRLAVDPSDARARKMLLARGLRYASSQQRFIYNCLKHLDFDIFIDVGVNYGECMLAVPLYCPTQILGFEANPRLIPFIKQSLAYNDDLKFVSVDNKAVSDRSRDAIDFYVDTKWSGTSSVTVNEKNRQYDKLSVACTTIDDELMKRPAVKRLLMKIDVEGHEPFVLKGGSKSLDSIEQFIILMEYDEVYITRGGVDHAGFFAGLVEKYAVYELRGESVARVHALQDLQMKDKKQNIHADIIITKSEESDSLDHFLADEYPGTGKLI
jgi:FkbM family methyltransferase